MRCATLGACIAASFMALSACEPSHAGVPAAGRIPKDPAYVQKEPVHAPALRVCADPNNLPFTNERKEGFENRLADLLAGDLHTTVQYVWWAQRRGFLRSTLNAGSCDVVMGLPTSVDMALTTRPYYRSTYVFVSRRSRHLQIRSFNDRRLRTLRIGVQLIGDDGANSPPAHALSRRGIVGNLIGFTVYGDYRMNSPPSEIVAAVARGDVDVAAVWGPLAGYFASRASVPLEITAVEPQIDGQSLPQAFSMAMAVRRGDRSRRDRLNTFIAAHREEIDALLAEYHIPRVDLPRQGS